MLSGEGEGEGGFTIGSLSQIVGRRSNPPYAPAHTSPRITPHLNNSRAYHRSRCQRRRQAHYTAQHRPPYTPEHGACNSTVQYSVTQSMIVVVLTLRLDGMLSSGLPSKMYSTPSFTSSMPGQKQPNNQIRTRHEERQAGRRKRTRRHRGGNGDGTGRGETL